MKNAYSSLDSYVSRTNQSVRKSGQSRQKRRKQQLRVLAITSVLMLSILCSVFAMHANAKTAGQDTPMYKYYASVQIMNGDSLWSIAESYTDGSVSEIMDCINEIKSINHLSRFETIKAGEFLIVPYYSADIL